MSDNKSYNSDLIAGLNPVIELPEVGKVFRDTTSKVAEKIAEEIRTTGGISELDKIILTPKMARNSVGVSYVEVMAYFNLRTTSGSQNIFRRGKKGNNNSGGGKTMMVNFGGGGNHSNYGMSDAFKEIFSDLVPQNDNGKAQYKFKQVQGVNGIVGLELDFNQVMALALGVSSNDAYDFSVVSVYPIGNGNNDFCIVTMKLIAGSQKGKTSGVNYSRIQQDRFNQVNAGGGRGGNQGGRSY